MIHLKSKRQDHVDRLAKPACDKQSKVSTPLRPHRISYTEQCNYSLSPDVLEDILMLLPHNELTSQPTSPNNHSFSQELFLHNHPLSQANARTSTFSHTPTPSPSNSLTINHTHNQPPSQPPSSQPPSLTNTPPPSLTPPHPQPPSQPHVSSRSSYDQPGPKLHHVSL
nr:putative proline-rich receptor-like protein kinase PERK11 [Penaeus vannamei]